MIAESKLTAAPLTIPDHLKQLLTKPPVMGVGISTQPLPGSIQLGNTPLLSLQELQDLQVPSCENDAVKVGEHIHGNNYYLHFSKFKDVIRYANALTDTNQKGKLFEQTCIDFFTFHPYYRNHVRRVYPAVRAPHQIWKKLNLPYLGNREMGVDIFVEYKNGKIDAVQCKNYISETLYSTKLSTFFQMKNLADRSPHLGNFVVAATCSRISSLLSYNYDVPYILWDSWMEENTLLEDIKNYYVFNKDLPNTFHLRNWQRECLNEVEKYFFDSSDDGLKRLRANRNRAYFTAACGTGKTLIPLAFVLSLISRYKLTQGNFVVFSPWIDLCAQNMRKWREFFTVGEERTVDFLVISSDKDPENKIISTCDTEKIHSFMTSKINFRIVVCTYNSSEKLVNYPFQFAAYDEAHHTAKRTAFNRCVDFPLIERKLFMTATPIIMELDDIKQEKYRSMQEYENPTNNEYGPHVYDYSFYAALKNGDLNDYRILIANHTEPDCPGFVNMDGLQYPRKYVIAAYAIGKAIKNGQRKIFTFHNEKKDAKTMSLIVKEVFSLMGIADVPITFLVSETKNRNSVLEEFRESETGVLCSVNILKEGIDIPSVDTVVFCDRKRSRISVAQYMGRALRNDKGKPRSLIILVNDPDALEVNESIFSVLKIIAELDQEITEELLYKKDINEKKICFSLGSDWSDREFDAENDICYRDLINKLNFTVLNRSLNIIGGLAFELELNMFMQISMAHNSIPVNKWKRPFMRNLEMIKAYPFMEKLQNKYELIFSELNELQREQLWSLPFWHWPTDDMHKQEWDFVYNKVFTVMESLPKDQKPDDPRILAWLLRQKGLFFKNGALSAIQREKCNAIPGFDPPIVRPPGPNTQEAGVFEAFFKFANGEGFLARKLMTTPQTAQFREIINICTANGNAFTGKTPHKTISTCLTNLSSRGYLIGHESAEGMVYQLTCVIADNIVDVLRSVFDETKAQRIYTEFMTRTQQ